MSQIETEIVILGAGLTGLTIAHELKKANKEFLLLEKERRIGGVIQTQNEEGFIFESGPNTGVVGNYHVAELFEKLSNECSLEIADPKAKKRWIWKNNRWNALPSGLFSAISTPLFSLSDKFRILGEPFRKKGTNELESVAGMVERRLGKSYLQYAVDPFVSGVYAGDPEKLITKYALPKLYALEQQYGSFIRGAMKKAKEPKSDRDKKATREVFSAKGGLGNLIGALGKSIGDDKIKLGIRSIKTDKNDNGYSIRYIDSSGAENKIACKKIITTFGGESLGKIFDFIPVEKINTINKIQYARIVQVILGYKNWKGIPINAFGGLVPSIENRDILGVLFTSSFFKERCPENGAILSVFLGGMKKPNFVDKDDDFIKRIVLNEIGEMLKVKEVDPDLIRIFKYQKAIPQYGIDSGERLETIESIQKDFPEIIMAGNIRDGIGMADRIKQAVTIANDLINGEN